MFSFQHVYFFWIGALVPVLLLIYILSLQRKKAIAKKIGDQRLVDMLTADFSKAKFNFKFILLLIAFIAGIFAVANFRSKDSGALTQKTGIDVMFALDVSNSMLAQDVSPSRLERAKQLIGKVIDRLQNDRVGIVVFAGKAYLQMPLSSDHSAAKLFLSSVSTEMIPTQGTVIGDALKMCNLSFNEKQTKYKSIVLISDGEDHDENAISQAEELSSSGVVIHTIGMGSPQGATIPDLLTGSYKTDQNGNVVYSKLNESILTDIAQKTNGDYQLFSATDRAVSKLITDLNSIEKREINDDSQNHYSSYFQIFMMLMFLLLLFEIFVSERKNYVKKLKPLVAALFFLIPLSSFAQSEEELIQYGNEAYLRKQYDSAIAYYKKAAAIKKDETAAEYNLGNALYKSGKVDEALNTYDGVLKISKNKMEQSAIHYNKGVVYQNNKKLDECIAAYKNALRINPDDEDARINLQRALRQKNQKEDQKQNKSPDKQQAKKQPSKLSQKEAEEKLQALLQKEKSLHDKLKKSSSNSANKPEKDW